MAKTMQIKARTNQVDSITAEVIATFDEMQASVTVLAGTEFGIPAASVLNDPVLEARQHGGASEQAGVDAATRARLKSLGYIQE